MDSSEKDSDIDWKVGNWSKLNKLNDVIVWDWWIGMGGYLKWTLIDRPLPDKQALGPGGKSIQKRELLAQMKQWN